MHVWNKPVMLCKTPVSVGSVIFPRGSSDGAHVACCGVHCVLLFPSGGNGVLVGEGVTLSETVPVVNHPTPGVAVTVGPRLSGDGLAVLRGECAKLVVSTTGEVV